MLRGVQDSRVPMAMALIGYWVIGAPVGLALGFLTPLGGFGLWIGLAVGLDGRRADAVRALARQGARRLLGAYGDGMTPLILDVDTGIDDAFGLLYALSRAGYATASASPRSPAMSASPRRRATRARCWRWRGAAIFPSGRARRRRCSARRRRQRHPRRQRPRLRRAARAAAGGRARRTRSTPSSRRRARTRANLSSSRPGPLTNIALAIARDPELPRRLMRFVVMGGAFACSGNVTAAAEFNIWHDPEAARMVFRAFAEEDAAPAILVGLDVTRQTRADGSRSRRPRGDLRRRAARAQR